MGGVRVLLNGEPREIPDGLTVQGLLEHLGVPPGYRPIGAVALGYPAAPDPLSLSLARGRRELDEVVHRGRWDRPAHPQEPA